ncbi:MAG: hypothetical protein LUB63_01385 [Oscillospiraceae bacterium]|nr:hypothetical protein [Oscillospiraceae bacterium]
MDLQNSIFAMKLCEMEKAYSLLQSRILLCQEKSPKEIHAAILMVRDECEAEELALARDAAHSRLPSVEALTQAQLDYIRMIRDTLLPAVEQDIGGESISSIQAKAEACTLVSEYAIDLATQSMRYALAAAMHAVEMQKLAEAETAQNPENLQKVRAVP